MSDVLRQMLVAVKRIPLYLQLLLLVCVAAFLLFLAGESVGKALYYLTHPT